ncbi:Mob1/phocein, partial [Sistotremastrum suecicum HHB10207 ss-3]
MAVAVSRPLRGTRIDSFYPTVPNPSLSAIDSAFQIQEYVALLVRANPHDVERIVSIPKGTRQGDDAKGKRKAQDEDKDETVDENCWIYEQLRRLAADLNTPLITTLQAECTRATCPEMKAGEWLYLCVAHGNGSTLESCCAIDYILHTLDSATTLLNSTKAFPSRLSMPETSRRHFVSLARRLGRIFAHAYFSHREAFEQAEAESSLYTRYLALTSKFDLVSPDFLNIP